MKKIIAIIVVLFALTSCNTKYNLIDTGLAKQRFDGNMFECMQENPYDWSLTCEIILRGGLQDLFQGNRAGFEKITFFGPTNHSIRRWMITKKYLGTDGKVDVKLISEEDCRDLILRHVVKGKYMRDDIPKGVSSSPIGTDGITFEHNGSQNRKIWVFSNKAPYQGMPEMGPVTLHIYSYNIKRPVSVASTNIEPDNGVIHSLHYNYMFGEDL